MPASQLSPHLKSSNASKQSSTEAATSAHFDEMEWRTRRVTLNVALAIGIIAIGCFGTLDLINHRFGSLIMAAVTIAVFGGILMFNLLFRRFLTTIVKGFVGFVGLIFLVLLATQFPHPTVTLWCLLFPLVALFLLGRKSGAIGVMVFDVAVVAVFVLDKVFFGNNYSFEYSIRYCEVLLVITILSYYFESSRDRWQKGMVSLNHTLEKRVMERTRDLEESQERLRQAEKLESIGRLAGGIAHDFNNQLAGIMAFADLIRVTAEEGSDIRQYAENILASSRRSADLTGQLLAFARKGNLLKMPVDMHRLIADLVSLLAHTFDKRISIIQALSASEATILGDPSQLHGAILNISINARDAMPGGGELSFTTNNLSLDPAYCATIPQSNLIPGKYLCISIADTGCGMDKETQQRIFEPFFTTKEPGRGTGMGLPAVYGIITSHNGAITVYSEKGKGTTVHLYFPLLIAQQSGIQTARDAGPRQKCEGNVLLVDDEQLVAEGSRKMLEALGYTATVFYTGTEALGYYADHWKDVDIVILDMIMPAMGGKETFVAMKQINPGIVALLASGYSINGEAQSILDTGVRGFIQKPFTLDELRDKLVSVLPVNRPPQSVT